jgi:hypothetical protein
LEGRYGFVLTEHGQQLRRVVRTFEKQLNALFDGPIEASPNDKAAD